MKLLTVLLAVSVALAASARAPRPLQAREGGLSDDWMQQQYKFALERIDLSMQQPGGAPGAVVAAPSKSNPDYWYFWVRDGSLTLDYIHHLLVSGNNPQFRRQQLEDFAAFSRHLQLTDNPSGPASGAGIGEPKFNLDGTAFTGGWGRPQDDGPAIRAFALTRYANTLLKEGKDVSYLYRAEMPPTTVIKADLEYVAHYWQETCFDIWEEVKGHHFYTRLVQRRALLEGADLARRLNDAAAADFYVQQANAIESYMDYYWDSNRKLLVTTLDRDGGLDYKNSQIDVQVVLAALHAAGSDDYLGPTSDRIQATAVQVINSFKNLYPINTQHPDLGTAIGRYPEDQYTGTGTGQGNAWVLATAAIAEVYYKSALRYRQQSKIPVTNNNLAFFQMAIRGQFSISAGEVINSKDTRFNNLLDAMVAEADRYMARIQFHTAADRNLHEQMDRYSGYMTGATHLTWSYVAYSTAYEARQAVVKAALQEKRRGFLSESAI